MKPHIYVGWCGLQRVWICRGGRTGIASWGYSPREAYQRWEFATQEACR
ncbi:hypothetical protein [Burkholderia ubonensis]|nr:hypothetical protein [Burkholderia ubonensis]